MTKNKNLVKLYRNKLGITQQELANKCNVSLRYIQMIETGNSIPTIYVAIKIAKTLKTNVEILFPL